MIGNVLIAIGLFFLLVIGIIMLFEKRRWSDKKLREKNQIKLKKLKEDCCSQSQEKENISLIAQHRLLSEGYYEAMKGIIKKP